MGGSIRVTSLPASQLAARKGSSNYDWELYIWVPLQCSLLIGLRLYHSNLSFLADICLRLLTKNIQVVAHFFDCKIKLSNIGVKSHKRLINNIKPSIFNFDKQRLRTAQN